MKEDILRLLSAFTAGLFFAFASVMFYLSRDKSRYWYAKKAKYAAILIELTDTESPVSDAGNDPLFDAESAYEEKQGQNNALFETPKKRKKEISQEI